MIIVIIHMWSLNFLLATHKHIKSNFKLDLLNVLIVSLYEGTKSLFYVMVLTQNMEWNGVKDARRSKIDFEIWNLYTCFTQIRNCIVFRRIFVSLSFRCRGLFSFKKKLCCVFCACEFIFFFHSIARFTQFKCNKNIVQFLYFFVLFLLYFFFV